MNKYRILKIESTIKALTDKIQKASYEYTVSNFFLNNMLLRKKISDKNFYLYYTDGFFRPKCIYWVQVFLEIQGEEIIASIHQELRPEIKYIYFGIPIFIWLLMSIFIMRNVGVAIILIIFQTILSFLVICVMGKFGKKHQIDMIIDFLQTK